MPYQVSENKQMNYKGKKTFGYKYHSDKFFRVLPISFFVGMLLYPSLAKSEVYFNPRFLSDDVENIADLSVFESGQEVPEGSYRVDVYLNDGYLFIKDINFKLDEKQSKLTPCFTKSDLTRMGVNVISLPGQEVGKEKTKEGEEGSLDSCKLLSEIISDSTSTFDVGLQRLSLTIPQIYLADTARGYISPDLWDQGIPAGIINYSLTGNQSRMQSGENRSYTYLNLQSGINLGAWRLRDNSTWTHTTGSNRNETKWEHINTFLERGINQIRSRLVIGDSYTEGSIFDSFNFRGIQLSSDSNMLPDSQRGFAPVIRGTARGTADVTIKQNGYEVYRNTFPPGPFIIDDLYANGNSGDLHVTITEADGSTQSFVVPFSTVPLLQREGHSEYSITAGEYRSGSSFQKKQNFFQGTLMRGLSYGWTMYGGGQLADRYRSVNLGLGKNIGVLGALSLDITQANAKLPDDSNHQGQSVRFLYSKSMNSTGTTFQLAGYRYSTKGFYTFADTTYKRMQGYSIETQDGTVEVTPTYTDYFNLAYNKREKLQLSMSQQLGDVTTLYITGTHEKYWNTSRADKQLQVGLNTLFKGITWGINYSLSKNSWQDGNDQVIALNANIPLNQWMRTDSDSIWKNSTVSYNASHDFKGEASNTAGLYGTLLEDNNLSYSVQAGYKGGGQQQSSGTGSTSLNYRGTYGNSNVGYSYNKNSRQFYYGVSGGILAHENGITLSQPMNDTVVLIKAPGADNVRIENQTGVKTDWRGYAVLPYATEYRENRIALDTNTLANNVDLDEPVVSVIPTKGAIVRASFNPKVGVKVIMTLMHKGKAVPFGAIVSLKDNNSSSIVADEGQVYLTGLPLSGQLTVRWGNGADSQCEVNYALPENSQSELLNSYQTVCL